MAAGGAISLSDEAQRLLDEKLRAGPYRSTDEVILAALRALGELEQVGLDAETLQAIEEAEAQIDQGLIIDWMSAREVVRAAFLSQ